MDIVIYTDKRLKTANHRPRHIYTDKPKDPALDQGIVAEKVSIPYDPYAG